MRTLRRIDGAFWWVLDKLAHIPHLGPRRYRSWVCKHVWEDTQLWFWSPPWQWGEWRSTRQYKAGKFTHYASDEMFFVSLDSAIGNATYDVRVDTSPATEEPKK